jgi:hypothetical protein
MGSSKKPVRRERRAFSAELTAEAVALVAARGGRHPCAGGPGARRAARPAACVGAAPATCDGTRVGCRGGDARARAAAVARQVVTLRQEQAFSKK